VKASPQVFQIAPKHPRAVILYVTGLNIMDRPNDVLSLARELKGNEPARIAALGQLARAQLKVRDFDAALRCADEALAHNPSDPEANLVRVQCLARLEKWEDVLTSGVSAYRVMHPGMRESREVLAALRAAQKASRTEGV
jgi:Flp pilus assembly protein TadD